MTRIWTGTASVVSGYTTVVLTGDPLTAANCPLDAQIVLAGATYFVGDADYPTMTVELTRAYEGTDGTVSAEIDPMTVETSTRTALTLSYTAYNARLALLEADGKGLFYTILGQTGANDPGPGKIARNAASWADVTSLYLDVLDAGGYSAAPLVDEWVTDTVITVRSIASRAYAAYRLLADPVDESGWRSVVVEYIGGDGILADAEDVAIAWNPLSALTLDYDAHVAEVADLAQFVHLADGYSVLVSDTGDGTPGIYTLDTSASPADWVGPAVLSGLPGPAGIGLDWQAGGWVTATAYVEDDGVSYNGSSYICLVAHTSGTFATDLAAAKWELFAAKGDPGDPGGPGDDGTDGADGTDPGVLLTWDDVNTDADPGAGNIRADNDALGSATLLYVSKTNRAGDDISAFLAALDDSTNTIKGQVTLTRSSGNAQAGFNITGITDATGYVKVAVSGHWGATGFIDGNAISFQFSRAGNKGTDGAGAGDVVGPASSANNSLAAFDGTTGKLLKDSGLALDTDGTLSANSDGKLASQKAVKTYVDQIIAAQDAMVFKGVIDCSGNPNYPAADRGWTYRVSVAGKIGGGSGVNVEVGDLLLCLTDGTASGNQATVGTAWSIAQTNLDGGVIGPASVTDGNPVLFDGTTGKLIKQSTFAAFKTALTLVKADVGLGNVDNTSNATERAATATLTNKTLVDPVITGTVLEDIYTITDGAGFQIDPGNGSIQQITLGASRTPAATNFANGEGILLMVNDGSAYTITWTTVGVVWIGGSAPTLATTGWTHIVLYKVGGTIYGKHVGNSA